MVAVSVMIDERTTSETREPEREAVPNQETETVSEAEENQPNQPAESASVAAEEGGAASESATESAALPEQPAAETSGPSEGGEAGESSSEERDVDEIEEIDDIEEESEEEKPGSKKNWYVVKVQSGREESIKEAIERRVKIENLEEYFGRIVIPVERVTEVRNNKRITKERKLYPGYLMVEVEFNDRILYLFRETAGVGDFVGGSFQKPPPPMAPHEVERMLGPIEQSGPSKDRKLRFERGDRVKIRDGTFAGMEGEVKDILEDKGQVRVELTIWGRPVSVEFEYWQVEEFH
ncbi:MAG: hypothetical protein KatS3mg105_2518 [Gemmatales bacterium]|nr:MAG: hypothetical protein KatS3mg105_2518 [Gemmatales bacterium]